MTTISLHNLTIEPEIASSQSLFEFEEDLWQKLRMPQRLVLYFILLSSGVVASLTMNLAEFRVKPFVQKALENPKSVAAVLSFFFGVDYENTETFRSKMRQGEPLETMKELWFAGGSDYDALCRKFQDTIRHHEQLHAENMDALVAEMILCDQLSRNAFRGTTEAFIYDTTAREIAKRLIGSELQLGPSIEGELYPTYASFALVPMMHSETPKDHEDCMDFISHMLKRSDVTQSEHLTGWFHYQMKFEKEHKDVIDKFGRYPHRNMANGRESTMEEQAWLNNVDDLPGWAKSQLA